MNLRWVVLVFVAFQTNLFAEVSKIDVHKAYINELSNYRLDPRDPISALRAVAHTASVEKHHNTLMKSQMEYELSKQPYDPDLGKKVANPFEVHGLDAVREDMRRFDQAVAELGVPPAEFTYKDVLALVKQNPDLLAPVRKLVEVAVDGHRLEQENLLLDSTIEALQGEGRKAIERAADLGTNGKWTAPWAPGQSIDPKQILDAEYGAIAGFGDAPQKWPSYRKHVYEQESNNLYKMLDAARAGKGETASGNTHGGSGRPTTPQGELPEDLRKDLAKLDADLRKAKSDQERDEVLTNFIVTQQSKRVTKATKDAQDRIDQAKAMGQMRNVGQLLIVLSGHVKDKGRRKALFVLGSFASNIAAAVLAAETSPILFVTSFMSSSNGLFASLKGESESKEILEQLKLIQEFLAQFEENVMNRLEEMDSRFTEMFQLNFNTMNQRFDELEQKIDALAKADEDRALQLMDLGQLLLKNVHDVKTVLERQKQDEDYDNIFQRLKEMVPDHNGTLPEPIFVGGNLGSGLEYLKDKAVAPQKSHVFASGTLDLSPSFASEVDSNRRREFYGDLATSHLNENGYNNLSHLNEIYRFLGTPLSEEENLPGVSEWAASAYGLGKMAGVKQFHARFKRWDVGEKGNGVSKIAKVRHQGELLRNALHNLRENPKIIGGVFDLQHAYIGQLEDLARNAYVDQAKTLSAKPYDLLGGSTQTARNEIEFKDARGNRNLLAACDAKIQKVLNEVKDNKGLGNVSFSLPDSLLKAINESIPSHVRMASELKLKPIRVCISNIGYADHQQRYTETENADYYEYNTIQSHRVKFTLRVYSGDAILTEPAFMSDPVDTEWKTAYLTKNSNNIEIFVGRQRSPTPGRPTRAQFEEGKYYFMRPRTDLGGKIVEPRVYDKVGHAFPFTYHKSAQGKRFRLNGAPPEPPYWDYPESKKEINGTRLVLEAAKEKNANKIFANAEAYFKKKKTNGLNQETLRGALSFLTGEEGEKVKEEILSQYRNLVFSTPTMKEKVDASGKTVLDKDNKAVLVPLTPEERRVEASKLYDKFKEELDEQLVKGGIKDEAKRKILRAEIQKHFDGILNKADFPLYASIEDKLARERLIADQKISEQILRPSGTMDWKYKEVAMGLDGLKRLIDQSLKLAIGAQPKSTVLEKVGKMGDGAIDIRDDIPALASVEIPERAVEKYSNVMGGLYDVFTLQQSTRSPVHLPYLSPDGQDLIHAMRSGSLEAKETAMELIKRYRTEVPIVLSAPLEVLKKVPQQYQAQPRKKTQR